MKVLPVTLKRHVAPDIHFPQIHRWSAVANPLGGDLAHTPRRLQADRVESCCDKTIFEFGRLTQVITHIRRKALGAAEELLDARPLQRRQALHRVVEHRFKVIKITGNLIKAEVLRDPLHAPRLG